MLGPLLHLYDGIVIRVEAEVVNISNWMSPRKVRPIRSAPP